MRERRGDNEYGSSDAGVGASDPTPGKRALTDSLKRSPVQLSRSGGAAGGDAGAFDAALASGAGEIPYRSQMEGAFGESLGGVQAYFGASGPMGELGATAAARGDQVAFAESNPSPWLVAHELTHVVQQRRSGATAVDQKSTVAPADSAAEREADRVADRVVSGQSAGEISAQPGNAIYRFAPGSHEAATIGGLHDSFSAEEIGAIYASNWERDFSQGHASIASAAIAWTAVKTHFMTHNGDPGPGAGTFQAAVWKVVDTDLLDAVMGESSTSLGGYKTWEHMDAPDDSKVRANADARWHKKANGVAGYIMDSKAHIKDHMVAAIDCYRLLNNLDGVGGTIDNWQGAAKPEGYQSPSVTKTGPTVSTHISPNFDDKDVASRDPLREKTAADAHKAGAKNDPNHNASHWRLIGQHLGRAMHAFEDFWAHSNWLELAKMAKEKKGTASNKDLKTGTFTRPAQAHALGHKLLALASGFQKDFNILLAAYGRKEESKKLDSKEAKTRRGQVPSDHELAHSPLQTDSWSTIGELSDVGVGINNVEELVLSGKYKMEDFLCNKAWLASLAKKGQTLITQGDENSPDDSHGKIAKDQEEGDGHKDHGGALGVAKEANELVFGPLRAIMDEKDAKKALEATQKQLALVDTMLQAPSESHPLWHLAGGGGGHDH